LFKFIFAVLLHLLIFRVDVEYSVLTHAGELKIVRLPSLECLCKSFGDFQCFVSASEITYNVSGEALNSTHSLSAL